MYRFELSSKYSIIPVNKKTSLQVGRFYPFKVLVNLEKDFALLNFNSAKSDCRIKNYTVKISFSFSFTKSSTFTIELSVIF